ncbi:universal stress protein A-like protein [Aristolochia californica]|uniref:universal stress protein A-like protein n=1 Tax=Aristolochia californica TaxID=171875 RepID=UPI0035E0CF22
MEVERRRKIVVALEANQKGIHALQWVLNSLIPPLTDSFTSNHFVILRVSPQSSSDASEMAKVNGKTSQSDSWNEEALELVKETCEKQNITYEMIPLGGEAKVVICEAAKKLAADLLVVGNHDYGSTRRLFSSGNVGDYCARNAKCPVVVVKGRGL